MGKKIAKGAFYFNVSMILVCFMLGFAWISYPTLYYGVTGVPLLSFERWAVGLFGLCGAGVWFYFCAKLLEDDADKKGWDD